MPHALELPGMRFAVVKLVRGHRRASLGRGVVYEFVALAFGHTAGPSFFSGRRSRLVPGLAAVVRTLNDLSKPPAGLRCGNAIGISRRSFQVIHFPSREMRPADIPVFTLSVRRQTESPLESAYS